ncbi:MAG: mechanosensitive ion channel family protein [Alphaproteobacteria bacterium]|nr:mechanosensitive ion channel family protein [Alphaproteobacteria bacterium]MBN2779908.1 mechanosensitive ion channel family protein [Alphaproteobacteria bacterium]
MNILSTIYFGNTVQNYAIAFGLIFIGLFLARSITWFAKNILLRLAQKSETRLDDIIVERLENPFASIVMLMGFELGLSQLVLPQAITFWADQIIFILMTFIVAQGVSGLINALTEEYFSTEKVSASSMQVVPVLRKALHFFIWTIAVIMMINHAGYNVTSLLAGLGLGGLAFAMASKDYISNIFGGVTVFTDKTFKIKDRVRIGAYDGTIEEIGLRSTQLKTLDGTIVTIPNSQFTGSMVENVSKETARKIKINLGIVYETPIKKIEKIQKILEKMAKDNPDVKDDVIVSLNQFGDFALNILFIFYVKKGADILKTINDIHIEILKQFEKEKIEFAYPTRRVIK